MITTLPLFVTNGTPQMFLRKTLIGEHEELVKLTGVSVPAGKVALKHTEKMLVLFGSDTPFTAVVLFHVNLIKPLEVVKFELGPVVSRVKGFVPN